MSLADSTFADRADALWFLNIATNLFAESDDFDGAARGRAIRACKTIERALAQGSETPSAIPPNYKQGK